MGIGSKLNIYLAFIVILIVALTLIKKYYCESGITKKNIFAFVFFFAVIVSIQLSLCNNDSNHDSNHDHAIFGGSSRPNEDFLKMNLMDPKHNMREIAKQLILLEDHMAHKNKRCVDCITKHFLMVEALLEEAITLDKDGAHTKEVTEILDAIKPIMMDLIQKMKDKKITDELYQQACQICRSIRKKIGLKYVLNN